MQALQINQLRKVYSSGMTALQDIDLSIAPGDFFGFLGENGAGKSTTIGIITSLITKTSGQVQVFGHDIDQQPQLAKRYIGLVPQEANLSIFEKVMDVLLYQAGYYGVPVKVARSRAEFFLKKLGLWERRDSVCMHLSGGMKRRLMVARALIHLKDNENTPSLLILDEPTAGVDVELRRNIWGFLRELNQQGMTIMLTTHYLEEAENLCEHVAIIDQGKIVEKADTRELIARTRRQTFVCDLSSMIAAIPNVCPFTIRLLQPSQIEVDLKPSQTINQLFHFFQQNQIEVMSLRNKTNRLESIFIDLIHHDDKKA